jgi:Protein of unknown function (DUF4230)
MIYAQRAGHCRMKNVMKRIIGAIIVAAVLVLGGIVLQRRQSAQEARSVGIEVSRTITASFAGMNALKVGTVSGDVLASSNTATFFGMVPVVQRSRAPYTVDYFVDLSKLSVANYRWNAKTRTMSIDVPDVTIAAPNIDDAKAVINQEGVYISRGAGVALQKQAAKRASAAATKTAQDPKYVAQARANARAAIAQLASAPLKAAGLASVRVAVRFPIDPKPASVAQEDWDKSTPVAEILAR